MRYGDPHADPTVMPRDVGCGDIILSRPALAHWTFGRSLEFREPSPVHRGATNRDLRKLVAEGAFRDDLFYRLNVVTIAVPPLRERARDIQLLARHFLEKFARRSGRQLKGLAPETMAILTGYRWPGNVRELEHIIERAVVLESAPGIVRASTIEPWLKNGEPLISAAQSLAGKPLADIEKQVILSTLQQFRGHRIKTATALGIGVRTLGMKLKRWKETGEFVEVGA